MTTAAPKVDVRLDVVVVGQAIEHQQRVGPGPFDPGEEVGDLAPVHREVVEQAHEQGHGNRGRRIGGKGVTDTLEVRDGIRRGRFGVEAETPGTEGGPGRFAGEEGSDVIGNREREKFGPTIRTGHSRRSA